MGLAPSDVIALRLADFTYPESHPLAGHAGVVFGYAVRHSTGVLLFDTGIGSGNPWVDEQFRPVRRDLREELHARGADPDSVVAIANSHLHFDHCGQNRLFPGVPIYVQRAEEEAARAPGYTVRGWVDFEGATYRVIDGDADLLPGIRALATPGHTVGHQSLAIETGEGLVVLAGHAESTDERIRAVRPRRIHFAHDDAVWGAID